MMVGLKYILLNTKQNEGVWEKLHNEFTPRHGAPHVIITYQGSKFKGLGFAQWLAGIGVEHRRTTLSPAIQ